MKILEGTRGGIGENKFDDEAGFGSEMRREVDCEKLMGGTRKRHPAAWLMGSIIANFLLLYSMFTFYWIRCGSTFYCPRQHNQNSRLDMDAISKFRGHWSTSRPMQRHNEQSLLAQLWAGPDAWSLDRDEAAYLMIIDKSIQSRS